MKLKQTEISIQKLKNNFGADMVRIVEIKNVMGDELLTKELGEINYSKYSKDGLSYLGFDLDRDYPSRRVLYIFNKGKKVFVITPGDYLEASKWEKVEYLLKKAGNRFSRLHKANPIVVFKV